jgi:hypothetical protein
MDRKMVTFNPEKLRRLKKAYAKCEPHKTFILDGDEYLKEYAGYLIQHLELVFGKERN